MKADLEQFECKAFHQTMGLAFLLMGAMWKNKHEAESGLRVTIPGGYFWIFHFFSILGTVGMFYPRGFLTKEPKRRVFDCGSRPGLV